MTIGLPQFRVSESIGHCRNRTLTPFPGILPANQICLFLDIDGTLIEFADTPDAISVEPMVIDTLQRLKSALDGALALVSGRAVVDVDRILFPLHLPAAGLHGVERRDAMGRMHIPDIDTSPLESVREALQDFIARHPGLLLEDKLRSLAVHYRRVPGLRREVRKAMTRASAGLAPAFILLEGDMVLELKPGGLDKAAAVEAFMRESPFRGRTPVFVGDDVTDCDGFDATRRLGGITVAVGPRVTAQYYLPDPRAACIWLARIAEQGDSHER